MSPSLFPSLSPQESVPLLVTIDGPAGTGKSTVARRLASRLGLYFLDTGAMYRAAGLLALEHGAALSDECAVVSLVRRAELDFDWSSDPPALCAFGSSVHARLRTSQVTSAASAVSSLPLLREELVAAQRAIATTRGGRLLSEGRDQGTVVFPNADVKVYLDASIELRARRRAKQLRARGSEVDVDTIEREIAARDAADRGRACGPLLQAHGAVVVDTSLLTTAEAVDAVELVVRAGAPAGSLS